MTRIDALALMSKRGQRPQVEIDRARVKVGEQLAYRLAEASPAPLKASLLVSRLVRDEQLTLAGLCAALYSAGGIIVLS